MIAKCRHSYSRDNQLLCILQGNDVLCSPCQFYEEELEQDMKFDTDKPDWSMLDLSTIEEIVKVYNFGALKYQRDSWKTLNNGKDRYFSALLRHLAAWQRGEELDKESNMRHLAHAAWNVIALMYLTKGEKNE